MQAIAAISQINQKYQVIRAVDKVPSGIAEESDELYRTLTKEERYVLQEGIKVAHLIAKKYPYNHPIFLYADTRDNVCASVQTILENGELKRYVTVNIPWLKKKVKENTRSSSIKEVGHFLSHEFKHANSPTYYIISKNTSKRASCSGVDFAVKNIIQPEHFTPEEVVILKEVLVDRKYEQKPKTVQEYLTERNTRFQELLSRVGEKARLVFRPIEVYDEKMINALEMLNKGSTKKLIQKTIRREQSELEIRIREEEDAKLELRTATTKEDSAKANLKIINAQKKREKIQTTLTELKEKERMISNLREKDLILKIFIDRVESPLDHALPSKYQYKQIWPLHKYSIPKLRDLMQDLSSSDKSLELDIPHVFDEELQNYLITGKKQIPTAYVTAHAQVLNIQERRQNAKALNEFMTEMTVFYDYRKSQLFKEGELKPAYPEVFTNLSEKLFALPEKFLAPLIENFRTAQRTADIIDFFNDPSKPFRKDLGFYLTLQELNDFVGAPFREQYYNAAINKHRRNRLLDAFIRIAKAHVT